MATVPSKLDLKVADYPSGGISDEDTLTKFFGDLNSSSDQVVATLAALSFAQNFNAEVKMIAVQVPASDWVKLTYANSWVDFGAAAVGRYRKDSTGRVEVQGRIKNGSSTGAVIATLPAAFRPSQYLIFPQRGPGTFASVQINPDGTMGFADLSATTDGSINFSFSCADNSPGVAACFPLTVTSKVTSPQQVLLLKVRDLATGPQTPVSVGQVHFENAAGGIKILNIPGLLPGHKYELTLAIFGS